MPCYEFIVSGRVQGVFFRASTQQQANRLNLTGHAINLPGGDVEVLACGDEQDLNVLETWLQHGPQYAEVSNIVKKNVESETRPVGFTTG